MQKKKKTRFEKLSRVIWLNAAPVTIDGALHRLIEGLS